MQTALSLWQMRPEMNERGRLLAQDLLDARDRLVDCLLGAETISDDAMDRLRPDPLRNRPTVPPVAGDLRILVRVVARPGEELHGRGHSVRVPRVEPERRLEQAGHRRQPRSEER